MLPKVKIVDLMMELGLYAAVFLPMYFFGGVETWIKTVSHWIVVLLLALFTVRSIHERRFPPFSSRSGALLGFFLAAIFLSTVLSVYVEDSLRSLIVFIDAIAIFAISSSMDRERKDHERILYVLLALGSLHCLYAIYKPLMSEVIQSKWHITGTFYNHNHFAAFVELLFFIPLSLLFFKKDASWRKYVLWFSMAVFSLALLLSLSRGALISVILTFSVFCILVLKKRTRFLAAGSLFFCPWQGFFQ